LCEREGGRYFFWGCTCIERERGLERDSKNNRKEEREREREVERERKNDRKGESERERE